MDVSSFDTLSAVCEQEAFGVEWVQTDAIAKRPLGFARSGLGQLVRIVDFFGALLVSWLGTVTSTAVLATSMLAART